MRWRSSGERESGMIRRSLALALLLGSPIAATAQDVGIKAGVTRSEILSPDDGWDAGTGFQAGVFYQRRLGRGLDVRPELLLTRRVTQTGSGAGETLLSSRLRVDYLELPLTIVASFRPGRGVRPEIFGGGFVAYKLAAGMRTEAGGDALDEDFSDDIERNDFGLVVGAGVKLQRGRGSWLGEIRYTRGTQRIDLDAFAVAAKNRSISALLGVAF